MFHRESNNQQRCFLATDVPKMAVIPAKRLESGLNFREANPLLCSTLVKRQGRINGGDVSRGNPRN